MQAGSAQARGRASYSIAFSLHPIHTVARASAFKRQITDVTVAERCGALKAAGATAS